MRARQKTHPVVEHFDESAFNVVTLVAPARLQAQLAVAEPADHRAATLGDAQFAVVMRQRDEPRLAVEDGPFRGDDEQRSSDMAAVPIGL